MKKDEILRRIDGIGDDLIAECAVPLKKERRSFRYYMPLTACACLAGVALLTYGRYQQWWEKQPDVNRIENTDVVNRTETSEGEIAYSKPLQMVMRNTDVSEKVLALKVQESNGVDREEVYRKFVLNQDIAEDYMTLGMIYATPQQIASFVCPKDLSIFLCLAKEEGATVFHQGLDQNYGAESFCIKDDEIYVLDTLGKQVICQKQDVKMSYPLAECKYPKDMYYYKGAFYIFDSWGEQGAILIYDENWKLVKKRDLPDQMIADDYSLFEVAEDGNLLLVSKSGEYGFVLEENNFTEKRKMATVGRKDASTVQVSYRGKAWDVEAGMDSFVSFLSCTDDVLYYQRCSLLPDTSELVGIITVEAVRTNGEYLGCVEIIQNEATARPNRYFSVADGECYRMTVTSEKTIIEMVELNVQIQYE